jgi:hypothetical protein
VEQLSICPPPIVPSRPAAPEKGPLEWGSAASASMGPVRASPSTGCRGRRRRVVASMSGPIDERQASGGSPASAEDNSPRRCGRWDGRGRRSSGSEVARGRAARVVVLGARHVGTVGGVLPLVGDVARDRASVAIALLERPEPLPLVAEPGEHLATLDVDPDVADAPGSSASTVTVSLFCRSAAAPPRRLTAKTREARTKTAICREESSNAVVAIGPADW